MSIPFVLLFFFPPSFREERLEETFIFNASNLKKERKSIFPSFPSISIEREEENGGDGEEETEETASASF